MVTHYQFAPDAARARDLDRAMRARLGESLQHLSAQCREFIPHDCGRIETLAQALCRGQRHSPAAFAHYYRLLEAVIDEQPEEAQRLFGALAEIEPVAAKLKVVPLTKQALGSCYALYLGLLAGEPDLRLGLTSPSQATFLRFHKRLLDGLQLLRAATPELAAEIEALVHEVVVVAGDESNPVQLDGGSHFQLWGALFVNGDFHSDDVAVAEVLAHESAHSLLFGFCIDEFLVENDDADLYSSPLRPDPRPMDGIYHATFVSARMHWALEQMLGSGLLGSAARERAIAANIANVANFRAGYQVIEAHGRLTALGQRLLQGASSYMAGAV